MKSVKSPLKTVGVILSVFSGALMGNALGDLLRERLTGEEGHKMRIYHKDAQGQEYIAFNPTLIHFLPAVAIGLLLTPHWLWALVSGATFSVVIGDKAVSWSLSGEA